MSEESWSGNNGFQKTVDYSKDDVVDLYEEKRRSGEVRSLRQFISNINNGEYEDEGMPVDGSVAYITIYRHIRRNGKENLLGKPVAKVPTKKEKKKKEIEKEKEKLEKERKRLEEKNEMIESEMSWLANEWEKMLDGKSVGKVLKEDENIGKSVGEIVKSDEIDDLGLGEYEDKEDQEGSSNIFTMLIGCLVLGYFTYQMIKKFSQSGVAEQVEGVVDKKQYQKPKYNIIGD